MLGIAKIEKEISRERGYRFTLSSGKPEYEGQPYYNRLTVQFGLRCWTIYFTFAFYLQCYDN